MVLDEAAEKEKEAVYTRESITNDNPPAPPTYSGATPTQTMVRRMRGFRQPKSNKKKAVFTRDAMMKEDPPNARSCCVLRDLEINYILRLTHRGENIRVSNPTHV